MKKLSVLSVVLVALLFSCTQKPNTDVKFIASEEFKKLNLPFSEAVIVGNIIYLSGQEGTLPGQDVLAEGGIKGESRQALENIKQVLEKNGSSMENIVKCTVMLADINEWADFNEEYVKFFPGEKPARSAFGTNGLALNARVEVECIAVIKR